MKNHKPSVVFDEMFNTDISQQYKFPFNLSADEVWDILKKNDYRYIGEFGNDWKLKVIMDNIDFPYVDFKTLTSSQKLDVVQGMCSGINSDDIIWYIHGNLGYTLESLQVLREMESMGYFHIGWVPSPKTLKRLKEKTLTYRETTAV